MAQLVFEVTKEQDEDQTDVEMQKILYEVNADLSANLNVEFLGNEFVIPIFEENERCSQLRHSEVECVAF